MQDAIFVPNLTLIFPILRISCVIVVDRARGHPM